MDILVRVSRKRKCFASLDWESSYWVMSFGNLKRPENDVEIEFTEHQLEQLKDMLNKTKKQKHDGQC